MHRVALSQIYRQDERRYLNQHETMLVPNQRLAGQQD
jgi:hypothetical protein